MRQLKARINIGIRKVIELGKGYYKLVRVGSFCRNKYLKY